MKTLVYILIIASSITTNSFSQETSQLNKFLSDSLSVITKRVNHEIISSRYMEQKLIYITDTLKGYEGNKVALYQYNWPSKNTRFVTHVYLLDASAEQIARWVIVACFTVTHKLDYRNTDKIISYIKYQSGGQFPVKGCVFENDSDEFESPYIYFKDGVTVKVKDNVRSNFKFTNKIDQIKESIAANLSLITNSNLDRCYKYGRICSTTRKQYVQSGGKADTTGLNWLRIVREEYKKALRSNSNFLITAWAGQNLK